MEILQPLNYFFLMVVFLGIILLSSVFTVLTLIDNSLITIWYDSWVAIPLGLAYFLAITAAYFLFLYLISLTINLSNPTTKESPFYRFLLNQTTCLILILGRVKVQKKGLEKVKDLPPFLLVANHRSNFDPFLAIASCPKAQLAYVAKPTIFKIPITGKIVHKCFFLSINRENDREALVTIKKAASLIKQGIVSIGIYPEGTRSKTGELLPFRNGSFKVAKWANCPIVIARTTDTEKIAHHFARKPITTTFEILDVLTAQQVSTMSTWEIGQYTRELILSSSLEEQQVIIKRRKENYDIPHTV